MSKQANVAERITQALEELGPIRENQKQAADAIIAAVLRYSLRTERTGHTGYTTTLGYIIDGAREGIRSE